MVTPHEIAEHVATGSRTTSMLFSPALTSLEEKTFPINIFYCQFKENLAQIHVKEKVKRLEVFPNDMPGFIKGKFKKLKTMCVSSNLLYPQEPKKKGELLTVKLF